MNWKQRIRESLAARVRPEPHGLLRNAHAFDRQLAALKRELAPDLPWYPYGTLNNFQHLAKLLGREGLDGLPDLAGGKPIVDIGTADGDTVFFLESLGYEVDAVDYAPTNYNGCRGFRAMREARGSNARLHEIDLDAHFELPGERYGLAFFLGILYHLKNPLGAMESLSRLADHALVSTRVARYNVAVDGRGVNGLNSERVDISAMPLAYLVAPDETNNDATNFWMFSAAGLRRLFDRSGWEVLAWTSVGDTSQSDPASSDHDERAFCLLRSRQTGPA
jgi:hypothetical protein